MKKIAILGSTGHIAKSLINIFCKESGYELFLFSRNPEKVDEFLKNKETSYHNCLIQWIDTYDYDVIINCIGIGNPAKIDAFVFSLTEGYDNIILTYLRSHPKTLYINLSSGAVYGGEWRLPVSESSYVTLNMNNVADKDFYGIAKLYSEAKHRALKKFNIVDLRIFGYFSRFINLDYQYFMCDVIKCVKNKCAIETSPDNIFRDYVNPDDLFNLIDKCIEQRQINDVFDVYSLKPISKLEILAHFIDEYELEYIVKDVSVSATGNKTNYYSNNKKAERIGYIPRYTSMDTIIEEAKYLI